MTGPEKVVKHLEMTQAIINRLGSNSFQLKAWSMTLIAAAMVSIARRDLQSPGIIPAFILPIVGFWILDGYFLWQERLFRQVYDELRGQADTDFKMDALKHRTKPQCSWPSAVFSVTLSVFYGVECALTLLAFAIIAAP